MPIIIIIYHAITLSTYTRDISILNLGRNFDQHYIGVAELFYARAKRVRHSMTGRLPFL